MPRWLAWLLILLLPQLGLLVVAVAGSVLAVIDAARGRRRPGG